MDRILPVLTDLAFAVRELAKHTSPQPAILAALDRVDAALVDAPEAAAASMTDPRENEPPEP